MNDNGMKIMLKNLKNSYTFEWKNCEGYCKVA